MIRKKEDYFLLIYYIFEFVVKKNYKKSLGKKGEEFAASYLKNKGYEIIAKNQMVGHGEIDLIAKKDDLYVFIEVKTRKGEEYTGLLDSIDKRKEENLIKSVEKYLAENNLEDFDFRIDLIGIIMKFGKVRKIEYVEGVL